MRVTATWILATSILASAACTQQRGEPTDKNDVTDHRITNAIETELWFDQALNANDLDVETHEGIVRLEGTVNNLLAKDRAQMIAEATAGVRGVVNQVEVNTTATGSDADLRKVVVDELLRDPATDSYEVDVAVSDGVVTLTGTVDSWQEKQLCSTVTRGIFGVEGVRNDLTVRYVTDRPDREIKPEIEARLANDVRVDDYLISVAVDDGAVTLSGTVGSLAEKRRASTDAWVRGVESVDADDLVIKAWARDEMRRKPVVRSDEELEEAVKDAFLYDPRVLSFNPQVQVDNGTVTLRGVVSDLEAKRSAEQDAKHVVGVWRVINHLKVRPKTIPSDDVLQKRVVTALAADPFVERFDVTVVADHGWVWLSGNVNSSFEKDHAESVVHGVQGVTRVTNNLDYDYSWAWKPDWRIEEDVADELFWSPYVDEEKVDVAVENGVVTLTGEVSHWSEHSAAEKNAFQGGAKDVRNLLTVRSRYLGPDYPYWDWSAYPVVPALGESADTGSERQ